MTLPAAVQAQFTYVTNNGALTITGYTGPGGAVAIPSTTNGMPVTSIGDSAFASLWVPLAVTSVAIPDGVTNIGFSAFYYCTQLASIRIPNSMIRIDGSAFNSCASLTSVTIPDGVTAILRSTFFRCTALTNVIIGCGVTNLRDGPFSYCTNLTGAFFRGNAPSLQPDAFGGDNSVTVYYLPGTSGWTNFFDGRPTALWKPRMLTSDASFGVRTNQFGFNISWASGMAVAVDACTNLANPVWTPLQTNTLTSDTLYFSDSQWANHPARFYRLRWP